MPIISVRDNENNRWKRNANKKKQRQKRTRGTKAIVKGWELNDFVVCNYLQIIWALVQLFKADYATAKMLQTIYILI